MEFRRVLFRSTLGAAGLQRLPCRPTLAQRRRGAGQRRKGGARGAGEWQEACYHHPACRFRRGRGPQRGAGGAGGAAGHGRQGSAQGDRGQEPRSEEHTSELQSLMRISYAVFCLKKKQATNTELVTNTNTYA